MKKVNAILLGLMWWGTVYARDTQINLPTGIPVGFVSSIMSSGSGVLYHGTSLGKSSLLFRNREVTLMLAASEMGSAGVASMVFPGANPRHVSPANPTGGHTNYLYRDQRWLGLTNYRELIYQNLYPRIDAVFSADARRVKTRFSLGRKANPAVLKWRFPNASVEANPDGSLSIMVGNRVLTLTPPEVQQNGRKVSANYRVRHNLITLALGSYNRGRPLTVENRLIYDSYFDDFATFRDARGRCIVAGGTASLFDNDTRPTTDMFVAQLNDAADVALVTTLVGGGDKDLGAAVLVAVNGNLYITGCTASADFPVTTSSALHGEEDAVLLCLDPNGDEVGAGTFRGGDGDDAGQVLLQNADGQIFVAGITNSSDFPQVPGQASFKTAFPVSEQPQAVVDYFAATLSPDLEHLNFSTTVAGPEIHLPLAATIDEGEACIGLELLGDDRGDPVCYTMNEYGEDYDNPIYLTANGFGFYALLWKYYRVIGTHTYSATAAQATGIVPVVFNNTTFFMQAGDLNALEANSSVFTPGDPGGGWQYDTVLGGVDRIVANVFWLHKWHTPIFTKDFNFDDIAIRELCLDALDSGFPGVEDLCDLSVNYFDDVVCTGSFTSYFDLLDWKIARWTPAYSSHIVITWPLSAYPFLQNYIFDPPVGSEGEATLIREAVRQLRHRITSSQEVEFTTYVNGRPGKPTRKVQRIKMAAILP